MGTLSYTLPTLGESGSQPATDITAALSALQTELDASMETANLADAGTSNKADLELDTVYSYRGSVGTGSWLTPELSIPAGSLLSLNINVTVTSIELFFYWYRDGATASPADLLLAEAGNTYNTTPGDIYPTGGAPGAPLLIPFPTAATFRVGGLPDNGSSSDEVATNIIVHGGFS